MKQKGLTFETSQESRRLNGQIIKHQNPPQPTTDTSGSKNQVFTLASFNIISAQDPRSEEVKTTTLNNYEDIH